MIFLLTMNMPPRNQKPAGAPILVHQVIAEFSGARTLEELNAALNTYDFIIVNEYHKDNQDARSPLRPQGKYIINTHLVGKAKEYFEGENGR
jgi:hypothetical protein